MPFFLFNLQQRRLSQQQQNIAR